MLTIGDQLFCSTLLTALFFSIGQSYLQVALSFRQFLSFVNSKQQDVPVFRKIKMALREKYVRITYVLDFLPPLFLMSAPVAIAVSATDSEYAGIAVLLSLTSLGQLASQQRATAGYKTYLERAYRGILVFSAVWIMYTSSGLNFLRTDLSGLQLSSKQDPSSTQQISGQYWRIVVACSVGIIPVNFTSRIERSVLGHFFKVTATLMVLLIGRGEVSLTCKTPSSTCASSMLSDWMWSRDSNQAVMTLLFVSTMAGDLSWRPKDEEFRESTTNHGTFIV